MKKLIAGLIITGILCLSTFAAWVVIPDIQEPEMAKTHPEPTAELIEKGRYLARVGNCIACHTVAGGTPYAGGRKIATPFGDVYSSNLTPDPETGLGNWSAADFWRAMHHGKSKDGRLLYPAFPYPNYTRVSRQDSDAIFIFLQSLPAVSSPTPAPEVRFPFNTRLALLTWRAFYFEPEVFTVEAEKSHAWNRGAYLVEGLGHCNACHTPRNPLGGSDHTASYSGGPIPMLGWDALPLTSDQPMTDADAAALAELLHNGSSEYAVTTGPMAEVVFHSLQYLTTSDIQAIVSYLRDLTPARAQPVANRFPVSQHRQKAFMKTGSEIYAKHCADCHGDNGEGKPYQYPALAGSSMVNAPSARNTLNTVLLGGYGPSTENNPRPYGMPPYAHLLSAEEIAAVITYIRRSWGNDASVVSPVQVQQR